jgi:hypothetical protein
MCSLLTLLGEHVGAAFAGEVLLEKGGGVAADHRKGSQAPSRAGRVQLSVHVAMPVRKALRMLAMDLDVTLQHLLCQAINDLFEKNGRPRIADEGMLPRGGAAHKNRNV